MLLRPFYDLFLVLFVCLKVAECVMLEFPAENGCSEWKYTECDIILEGRKWKTAQGVVIIITSFPLFSFIRRKREQPIIYWFMLCLDA